MKKEYKRMKRIIIVGGMGPQASLFLHKKLLDKSVMLGACNGEDFPEILHLSLPIADFIHDGTKMRRAALRINKAFEDIAILKNDQLVIACNTAHLLVSKLDRPITERLISLIDVTVGFIRHTKIIKIGLLASPTTIQRKLYQKPLEKAGVSVILPLTSEQRAIENSIRATIVGKPADIVALNKIIARIIDAGAQAILLGCTELSVAFSKSTDNRLIDPIMLVTDKLLKEQ